MNRVQNDTNESPNKNDSKTTNSQNVLCATNDSIKLIAESIGINNLSEEACRELANDLTFTVKSLLLDAQKFSRRSRRKNLNPSDIDYALKVRSFEPIYGFNTNDPIPFRCSTMTGSNASGRCVFYVDDQIVDLNDVITTNNSTIKLPNDFVINAHWLAIEGVQPSVPENPQLVSRDTQKKEAIEGTSIKTKDKIKLPIQKNNIGENLVKLKNLVPHDLSMEQQFYFKEITEACVGSDEQKRTEALNSLSIDPGLHQLLPRFILFISEGVRLNIIQTNMAILIYLMRMAKALIENKSIYLEKYLHELLPSIFSCLLSKQLCARPDIDNHYALREFSALLVGQVLKTYGSTLTFLQSRILNVYLEAIKSEKTTFSTLFGALVGIAELGDDIFETVVFPMVKVLGEKIAQVLDGQILPNEKIPADRVKQELIKIISRILKAKSVEVDDFDQITSKFGSYLGQLIFNQVTKSKAQSKPPQNTNRQSGQVSENLQHFTQQQQQQQPQLQQQTHQSKNEPEESNQINDQANISKSSSEHSGDGWFFN
ncbi:unnamed protein product [Brachionus calyciflorus]|uniref:Histone H4 n=1 Tax=Brachionus calyciflorus TaxID=104777 RepID=A0A813QQG5_9BILA|nr:unnamed protein product [Brachionus calyciflorus]